MTSPTSINAINYKDDTLNRNSYLSDHAFDQCVMKVVWKSMNNAIISGNLLSVDALFDRAFNDLVKTGIVLSEPDFQRFENEATHLAQLLVG